MVSKILIIILFYFSLCNADIIETRKGTIHEGIILESTNHQVNLQINDSTILNLKHSDILSIFFTYADVIYFLSEEPVKCKILEERYPKLKVITAEGIKYFDYNNIEKYYYNEFDGLQITSLPPTTYAFNNRRIKLYNRSNLGENVFVSMNFGINKINNNEWKKKFLSPEIALGIEGGINVGYAFSENSSLSLGYEYSNYKITVLGDLKSSFNTSFIYLSPTYLEEFGTSFIYYMGLAVDCGLFKSSGNLYLYSYRNIELKNQKFNFAVRPKFVIRLPIIKNLMLDLDTGYLFAKSNKINMPVKSLPEFAVSFSGFSLILSVYYQIPYSF